MPRYDYRCHGLGCSWTGELFSTVQDRNWQRCPECNAILHKQLSAPIAKAVFPTAYQKDMRRKGMIEVGDASLHELKKWDEANRQAEEARQERALEETASEVVQELGELGDNLPLVSE